MRWFCLLAALVIAPACSQPRVIGPTALEAPVVSPPAHASIEQRIEFWEQRLPALAPTDQAEARLCLGELYLEQGAPEQARLNFYASQNGYLSAREDAQAAYGIGRSYLLQDLARQARPHLIKASADLDGPEGDECRYLAAFAGGRAPQDVDARILLRVATYTEAAASAQPAPSVASHAAGHTHVDGHFHDVSRDEWGARRLLANHDSMSRPFRITVHHTAEPARTMRSEDAFREMRDLQRLHQQDNGWADLGYHYLIDQAGRIIEGRPIDAQGAHAGNAELNRGNIGICLIGNFVAQPERGTEYSLAQAPTDQQMEALDNLVDELTTHYGISNRQVWAHSHLKETACPGPYLLRWADGRRSAR